MNPSITDWVQAIASLLILAAAIVAARIAWKAPKLAAQYAEAYRRETAMADELRQFQVTIFRALMKGRAELMHQDTRAAINLVEAAFPTDRDVREARRMFTKAANADPFDSTKLVQAYLLLLEGVAKAVGLGEHIDRFDVESGYYPRGLGLIDEAALTEAAAKIAKHSKPARKRGG